MIRVKLAERRTNAYDLASNDPGGLISALEFRNRIIGLGFVLRDADVQTLARRYRVGRNGEVNWNLFCADVAASQLAPF
jgi:Ca2+-binding EF-hand superfamily protein